MFKLSAIFCIAAVASSGALGPHPLSAQSDDVREVRAVVEAFHGALAAGDSTAALGFLAADVTILESGAVEDKSHYRSGHLAGDMRFAQAIPRVRGEMNVTIVGDAAWASSTNTAQGKMGDRDINSAGAELVVLTRDQATWTIRAIHWSSRARSDN